MSIEKTLAEIEATLAQIEALDAVSKGKFRQASDKEAYDVACRIERKMNQSSLKTKDIAS